MTKDPNGPGEKTASSPPDSSLLMLVRQGDEQAMTLLFARYSGLVYSVALRILHDPTAAEDIMQEIFMQVWSKPARFTEQSGGTLGGWFAVVSRNRSIDLLRNQQSTDSVDDVVLLSPCDVANGAEHNILLDKVRVAIAELPPEQRNALELAYFRGLSHTEIAHETGHTLGTIKTRIRTALHTLGRAFKA